MSDKTIGLRLWCNIIRRWNPIPPKLAFDTRSDSYFSSKVFRTRPMPSFRNSFGLSLNQRLRTKGWARHISKWEMIKLLSASFSRALTLDPKLWRSHNFLGMLHDRHKQHREAIAEYQAGLALQPNESALHNNLGLAYYLGGQYQEAVRSFRQALVTGSGQPRIHNNLGLAYAKLEWYHDALEAFKKGSDEPQAYNNLGSVYLGSNKPRKAVACFQKAIDLHPRYYAKANENLTMAQHALTKSSAFSNGVDGEKDADSCP